MSTRTFALVWGIVFLVIFVGGLVPGLLQDPAYGDPMIPMHSLYGRELGLFPVNVLHDGVHLLFGVWGLIASRHFDWARTYAQVTAVMYAIFAVMGAVPSLSTTFGMVPLFSHDIWLHVLLAVPAAYFGFVHRDNEARTRA